MADGGRALYDEEEPASLRVPPVAVAVAVPALASAKTAQVIGSVQRSVAMERSAPACRQAASSKPAAPVSEGQAPSSSACSRLPVFVLALASAGACVAAGIHFHASDTSEALRQEVERLREQNQVLHERAALAQTEQQELARIILDPRSRQRLANMMDRSQAFSELARRNGFQSHPGNTASVRDCLARVFWELNITSVLDVPCGDASWQHLIPGIGNMTYVGADINIGALETAKHRSENVAAGMEFMLFDAVHFPLKRSFDLVLYRDVAEQQRVQDTLTAVLNFKESGSRYLAASYWPQSPPEANEAAHNLEHAGWYEANLLRAPFHFPEPLVVCENADLGTPHRGLSQLGIWRLRDLPVTAKSVEEAQPERHKPLPPKRRDRFVHLPPAAGSPGAPQQRAPQLRGWSQKRPKEVTLDELLNAFGSAFAPERLSSRPSEAQQADPFDGLFSDWLETAGPVRRGPPSRRPGLPSQLFELPGFLPLAAFER